MHSPMPTTLIVLALLLSGCATNPPADTNSGQTFVRVFPVTTDDELNQGIDEPSSEVKAIMQSRCFEPSAEVAPLVGTILSALVGSGVRLGLDAMGNRLKRALDEYSASYAASYGGPFNHNVGGRSAYCWRIVRGRLLQPESGVAEIIDFDATLALKPHRGKKVLQVEPLRLIVALPAPKKQSTNDKYGIAVSLRLGAGTDEGFKEIFDDVVIKDSVTYTGKPVAKYYGVPNEICEGNESLIYCGKMNTVKYVSQVPADSQVSLTATVAESGAPSGFLSFAANIFAGAKDDIGDALAEAAAAKINPSDE